MEGLSSLLLECFQDNNLQDLLVKLENADADSYLDACKNKGYEHMGR